MTCIEKLRELHPEWDEDWIRETVHCQCPSTFDLNSDPEQCPKKTKRSTIGESCPECWNREVVVDIPHEFEFIHRNTIVYDAVNRIVEETKMHMTVLERVKQYYTGKLVYKIRRQSEEGWIDEGFYTEKEVREMLAARVEK